nr:hypothetical protein [uncultured bacterium]
MNTIYNPDRDISDYYIDTISNWIAENGEVLVVIRALYGGRDYALLKSKDDLTKLIEVCREGADIIAIRGNPLIYKGEVTETFINEAYDEMSDKKEYLYIIACPEKDNDPRLFGEEGYTEKTLKQDLSDHMGELVFLGPCPNYMDKDSENLISASKGGIDGPR